jgi:hypothetical protein
MVGLGVYLLVAVSSVSPTAATARAETCTYDQAACDVGDSGECAALDDAIYSLGSFEGIDEPRALSLPPSYDPRLAEYLQLIIETCDMPRGPAPGARFFTLRTAGRPSRLAGASAHASAPVHAPPRSEDMPLLATTANAPPVVDATHPLFVNAPARPREAPASRLERPPSA